MLWLAILASCALAIPFPGSSRIFRLANDPGFDRGNIESRPPLDTYHHQRLEKPIGPGEQRLPLRDAVEALPENIFLAKDQNGQLRDTQLGRVPLRDAVEHREAPFFTGPSDHESIWIEPLVPPTIRGSQQQSSGLKVVCHLDSKAAHRADPFSLLPQRVPYHKCTHFVYDDAATLDPHNFRMVPRDPEYDEIKGGYKSATGLRSINPALRILVSLSSPEQGRLFAEATKERCSLHCHRLSRSIVDFLKINQFDGLEVNWETSGQHWKDFKSFLAILKDHLAEEDLILAVAIRPEDPVDPEVLRVVDLALSRPWRDVPGERREMLALHPAPLKFVARFLNKWTSAAGPELSGKLILGLALFGQGYTLRFGNFTDAGAPVIGPSSQSAYTQLTNGRLAYFEVCEKLEDGLWTSGRDEEGPYVKRADQWIGYEDPISVKIKMALVRSLQLAGVSLFSLDLDDFQGICGEPWPMLGAATRTDDKYERCTANGLFADPDNCSSFISCSKGMLHRGHCGLGRFFDSTRARCVKATPGVCKPGQSDRVVVASPDNSEFRETDPTEHLELAEEREAPRVVCYITSWALYRKGQGKFVPEHLDARLCTDVVYAFAGLNPDSLLVQPFDPWADVENNLYQRVTSIKGPRVLLALGGWTDSSGDKYSRLVGNGASRRKFVAAAITFLRKHNFDGLSLEWNYPKCWQSNCKRGADSDKPNFTKLVQELRKEFDRQEPRLFLAVALSGYKEVIDKGYEVADLSKAAHFLSVMTYDYHGAYESKTGHLAPLYVMENDNNPYYNVNFTMEYLVSLGAERSKLFVGMPFYGQSYRLSHVKHSNLGDPTTGPGTPGEFTKQPGMLAYYEICERIKNQAWQTGLGPSAHHKEQWVSYDDANSLYEKGEFVRRNGYGGATTWTVDLDDFSNRCCYESFPLLKSLNRALGRLLTPAPTSTGDCRRPAEPVTPIAPTLTTHSDAVEGGPVPTKPMTSSSTTTKTTTWPTWTEQSTIRTTWPTWSWTQKPTTTDILSSRPTESTTRSSISWTWTEKHEQSTVSLATSTEEPDEETSVIEAGSPVSGKLCNAGEYTEDPVNCGNYFRCVLGELRREQCAPGLHWDARRRLCDWPASAKCRPEAVTSTVKPWTPPKKTTTQSTPTAPTFVWSSRVPTSSRPTRLTTARPAISTTGPVEKPEKHCEHGKYYAYPDSCTSFLVCVNGNLVSQQCGPGLNWNDQRSMCDWAFKSPCEDKPKKVAPLIMKEDDSCVSGSYTSVPGDCESYQACLWGRHEIFRCAPGLHFNKQTRICDWPARANCNDDIEGSSTPRPSTTKRPTVPIYTENPFTTTTTTTSQPASTLPSAEVDPSKPSPLSGHFKVVCYFTNWAWYRRGIGRYLPEHIDHTLCTHIVYGFAVLDYSELTIKAHDSWADFDNRFYERVVAYKQRGLKVSLALGGWNDSAGDKYSRLVNSPSARRKFIRHVIQFIEKYGFDGLDLDWEYPVCWQVDCKKGAASDKDGFSALLQELSIELRPKGLLLSSAVSPSKTVIDAGYDVPILAKYLDWIAVMTYDFHGQWDKRTGHVAPLYYHPDDEFYYFNANYSINYWISKGAPARSIVMGMPLYGQSFSINDPKAGSGLNVGASAGNAGEFTRASGFLAYYEICERILNRGWEVVQDPERRMGPYAYKGNQWVSFDDSDMIRQKAQFVRDMGLGGGMIWALDLDDFRGRCGEGPHPLMHTLQQVLAEPPNKHDRPIRPPAFGEELDWELPAFPPSVVTTTPVTSGATAPIEAEEPSGSEGLDDDFKVVCYFTNWAWYRQAGGRFVPEDIDPELCTHVLYGFAVLDGSSLTIKTHDSWADIDNKFYERVAAFKKKGIKVLMAIGGWNDSAGDKYSRLVNSPSARRAFITHVLQFIDKYGFEGLDLDWEYPVCWQVDCKKGPISDKEAFSRLVQELSAEFKPRGLLLSSAVSPSKRVIDAGYDVPVLAKYLDWISIMAYDYHGQWDKKTGHVAPLYVLPNDWEKTFNANFSVNYWISKGAPARKLVMGVPLYGQSFSLAEIKEKGLNSPTYGGGEAGEATRARGFLSYYEICERTLQKGWTVVQDSQRRIGPYAFKGDQWVSFDDAEQARRKARFIKDLGLGGGMVWALDLDDFKNKCGCEPSPLLRTINRVLRNYPKGPLCPITTGPTLELEIAETPEIPDKTTTEGPIYQETSTSRPNNEISTSNPVDPDDTVQVDVGSNPPTSLGDCDGRLFIPHSEDCSKYFLCNFGNLSEQSCPPGLFWNENRCDWPENTNCIKTGATL